MEIVKLLIKVAVIMTGTFGAPLVVAFLANQNKLWRRVILCGMVLLLVRPPGNFTLMLYSVDWYRGPRWVNNCCTKSKIHRPTFCPT